ncbi:hypothetical protein BLNAU_23116 [Blattamonas nauphoetae]|uniref:B30.2/SPRY domain-containing protein n=1 Tax=Blattamonas nauphoetae TaxID=2049346 RepID=A0ABQ9WR27_9EUKA|nr:hypothetical protein BLNAU_23116 [Blattamonas nauphoetae]
MGWINIISLSSDTMTSVRRSSFLSSLQSSIANETESKVSERSIHFPLQLIALPPLLFTDPADFVVDCTTFTLSACAITSEILIDASCILLGDPVTTGIVSVTLTILSLPAINYFTGRVYFGLLDSPTPVPDFGDHIGLNLKNSVALDSSTGRINSVTPSTRRVTGPPLTYSHLKEGACVRMEVDMDSTPRTVQFFMNGKAGRFFVSGLPPSVRIGFSVFVQGTSFRIDRITRLTQQTPIAQEMEEIKCTQTTKSDSSCLNSTVVSWRTVLVSEMDQLDLGLRNADGVIRRSFKTTTQQFLVSLLSSLIDVWVFIFDRSCSDFATCEHSLLIAVTEMT